MKKIVSYNAGWIQSKSENILTENFTKIFLFYVINTICKETSSSSKPMGEYGWDRSVWGNKKDTLKNVLYEVCHLDKDSNPKSLSIAIDTDKMHEALVDVNLNGNFHINREYEKVCIYKPSKHSEFVAICYHIRNSLAHGRFTIYPSVNGEAVYVMEDGKHCDGDRYEIRARMILKESTLIAWKDLIEGGPAGLENINHEKNRLLKQDVIRLIENNERITKNFIVNTLHINMRETNLLMKELKDEDAIEYSNERRSWVIKSTN